MNTELAIGVLTGSLGTLLIKETFNYFNNKQRHAHELVIVNHEKKLESAEKAIGFYSTYLNTIIEIKTSLSLMEKTISEDTDLDVEIIQKIIEENSKIMTNLLNDKRVDSNGVHLYFDLENEAFWNENDLTEMAENIAKVKFIDNEILFLFEQQNKYQEAGNHELSKLYENDAEEKLYEYAESIRQLIKSYDKNKLAIKNIIKEIKTQL